jgi:integrase
MRDEQLILEHAAKSRSPYLYTNLVIAFSTGMRAGEIRQLRWDRFIIGDSHSESYVRVGESKSEAGRDRVIPMDRRLWEAMTRYRTWYLEKLGRAQPGWYVFPYANRRRPTDPTRPVTSIKQAWQGLKKELKINYRLHDARHTVATAMAVAQVSDAKRRYLMGHVSENVIKRYTHLQAEDCRQELEHALTLRRKSTEAPPVSPPVMPKRRLQVVLK